MIHRNHNGVAYYQFRLLADVPGVEHAVFTRSRGFSRGPYATLNAGLSVGDAAEQVARNRELISNCLGNGNLQFVDQIHGDGVVVIDPADPPGNDPAPRGDALVADGTGVTLVTLVADCQPVLIYDPIRQVIANVHSGWRGSVSNIIGRTIAVMTDRFDCLPENLLAGIGPSLGPCCAEFVNFRSELPPEFWQYKDVRDHFDFWAVSSDQLRRAGLMDTHIEVAGICTRCRTDLFYSYRAEGTTGRFAAAIGMVDWVD